MKASWAFGARQLFAPSFCVKKAKSKTLRECLEQAWNFPLKTQQNTSKRESLPPLLPSSVDSKRERMVMTLVWMAGERMRAVVHGAGFCPMPQTLQQKLDTHCTPPLYVKFPVHAEKSFRNLLKSTQNHIVFTIFRLIWIQTDIRLDSKQ